MLSILAWLSFRLYQDTQPQDNSESRDLSS